MGLPVQVTAGVMYMNEEKPPSPEKAPLAFLPLTLTLTLILPLTLTLTLILTLTLPLPLPLTRTRPLPSPSSVPGARSAAPPRLTTGRSSVSLARRRRPTPSLSPRPEAPPQP